MIASNIEEVVKPALLAMSKCVSKQQKARAAIIEKNLTDLMRRCAKRSKSSLSSNLIRESSALPHNKKVLPAELSVSGLNHRLYFPKL